MTQVKYTRGFTFFRSLSRNAVARLFDLRIKKRSTGALHLTDPGIGIWSYSLVVHTATGQQTYGRVSVPSWEHVALGRGRDFDILVHDEDSGADIGIVAFRRGAAVEVLAYPRGDFAGPDAGGFCTRLVFPKEATEADLLAALGGTERLEPGSIRVGPEPDRLFALYTDSAEGRATRSASYGPEGTANPEAGDSFVRAEIFCKDTDGILRWRAICDAAPAFHDLGASGRLYHRFTRGTRESLVIYFDYSRSFEKISVYQEYLPKFNMRTQSSVLVLGNCFGFWGTATSFGSDGRMIVADVLAFLKDRITEAGARRVYLVGGSQGASAALVFGGLLPDVMQIHAAVPVPFSTKAMLRHLADEIRPQDIQLAEDLTLATLRGRAVDFYSTIGDPLHEWHAELTATSDLCRPLISEETGIGHDDCLRHYIKHIYAAISESEETFE